MVQCMSSKDSISHKASSAICRNNKKCMVRLMPGAAEGLAQEENNGHRQAERSRDHGNHGNGAQLWRGLSVERGRDF